MNPEHLKYFVEVYRTGSLYKAAQKLYISPQGISQAIKRIEDSVGTPLFERSKIGLIPTDFCHEFYSRAVDVVSAYESMNSFIDNYRQDKAKELVIALMGYNTFSYLILSMIQNFQEQYPGGCRIVSQIFDADQYDQVFNLLNSGAVDLAWTFHTKNNKDFDYLTIRQEDLKCVVSTHSPLADKEKLSWADLDGQNIVLPGKNEPYCQLIVHHCEKNGVKLNEGYYSTDVAFVARTINQGENIGVFYSSYINTLKIICPDLLVKEIEPRLNMKLSMFFSKKRTPNKLFTDLTDFGLKYLTDNLVGW